MEIFPESSFFKEKRAPCLPSPTDIRSLNLRSGSSAATSFNCPPPVTVPSLGLVVKYGADVSIVEAQTQIMLQEKFNGRLPVPEVFGWAEDKGQTFIYMSHIEGDTLLDRWDGLTEDEKRTVCEELHHLVSLLRSLKQDPPGNYIGRLTPHHPRTEPHSHHPIGSIAKQPLKDIFVAHHPGLAGPFHGAHAVNQFQDACGIDIDADTPIVFTHNDLLPPNVILAPGPSPKVVAIIDWGQAGWYPAYWEYCKARWIRVNPRYFSDISQEHWRVKYLPLILDPVDDETVYHPWLYFVLSKGI